MLEAAQQHSVVRRVDCASRRGADESNESLDAADRIHVETNSTAAGDSNAGSMAILSSLEEMQCRSLLSDDDEVLYLRSMLFSRDASLLRCACTKSSRTAAVEHSPNNCAT